MLMRQPKQTPAPLLMKAAACLRGEGARAHNKQAHPVGGAAAQALSSGDLAGRGVCLQPTRLQLQQGLPPRVTFAFTIELTGAASGAQTGGQGRGSEHLPPLHGKLRCAPKVH